MKVTLSDISVAAFFLMRGLKLLSAKKLSSKFEFVFEDPNSLAEGLENEYIMSDISRYDAAMRRLKSRINGEK